MTASNLDGPLFVYGNTAALSAAFGSPLPDPNLDAGPSMFFQGHTIPDVRYPFPKDQVTGYTGRVPTHSDGVDIQTVDAVPGATGVATIAAAQNATNGTAFTLVTAQAAGITPGVPIRPMTNPGVLNGGAVTNVLALDFGFAFGNCTAGNASIVVADSTQFTPGEPLVIGGAGGNATAALLTNVLAIVDPTHITVGPNVPGNANATAPIGTGNYWGPSELGFPLPDAALPYIAAGPSLLLDPRQGLARAVQITGSTSATGGNFLVQGFDIYGQPMAEMIAAAAGAVTTKGKKAWKYITAVTPQFTDAHAYSVGTADIYGFAARDDRWEYNTVFWAGAFIVTSPGWTAPDLTSPATRTTGDVRGTYATASASTGSIVSLVMTGNRLALWQSLILYNQVNSFPVSPQFTYGQTQAQ